MITGGQISRGRGLTLKVILKFPCGCLENSDLENSDPLGVSKAQTPWVSVRQRVPKNAANRLVYCSSIPESAEKIKRLAVEETCTDHKKRLNTLIDISATLLST